MGVVGPPGMPLWKVPFVVTKVTVVPVNGRSGEVVKTASGACAVQIVYSTRRGSRDVDAEGPSGSPDLFSYEHIRPFAAKTVEVPIHMARLAGAAIRATADVLAGLGARVTVVEFLDRIGCLEDWASFAHSIWLDPNEVNIFARSCACAVHRRMASSS